MPHPPTPGWPRDALAGLNTTIVSVPTSMAASLLAGVNPLFGLYAGLVGPLVGGALTSTRLMVVTATTAAALTAGQVMASVPAAEREPTLGLIVLLAGIFLLLLGWLRLDGFMRFISYSVMTGLLAGISVLIVLSQLPLIARYEASGSNRLTQTLDLLSHLPAAHLRSVAVAAITLALAATLPRTRLRYAGMLMAMILPSMLVPLFGWHTVPLVRTAGPLVGGLPAFRWPVWSMIHAGIFTGALSVAVIVLVQSAGVSQGAANPDGTPVRLSRDFLAQGAANLAAAIFQALPVGGSVSETALIVVSGARTRWAVLFTGVWMGVVLLVATRWVGYVAMPALEGLLVFAGVHSFQWGRILTIWQSGWHSRAGGLVTFAAALLLPIQAAVGIGVGLSGLLYIVESSADVKVVELRSHADGSVHEIAPPRRLPSDRVLVLQVYGHLFYASAPALKRVLPPPRDARRPAVVLRLRGYSAVGATLIEVLAEYSRELGASGGRLYLSGLSSSALDELRRSGKLELNSELQPYTATTVLGQSSRRAYADAQSWRVRPLH